MIAEMKAIPCKWGECKRLIDVSTKCLVSRWTRKVFIEWLVCYELKCYELKCWQCFCSYLKHRLIWAENTNMKSLLWKENFYCMCMPLCALLDTTTTCQVFDLLWCTFCNKFDSKKKSSCSHGFTVFVDCPLWLLFVLHCTLGRTSCFKMLGKFERRPETKHLQRRA